jgi:hypothetical protein
LGSRLRFWGDLDLIPHFPGARCLGETRGHSLVLGNLCRAGERGDPAADGDGEPVLADLGGGKAARDGTLEGFIAESRRGLCGFPALRGGL